MKKKAILPAWRLEDQHGIGVYQSDCCLPWRKTDWQDVTDPLILKYGKGDDPKHPAPYYDNIPGRFEKYASFGLLRFAFISVEQARAWFDSRDDLVPWSEAGLRLRAFDISRCEWGEGGHQIVYLLSHSPKLLLDKPALALWDEDALALETEALNA